MPVEFRAIRAEEREDCLRLWNTVWSNDNEAYFRRYFYGDVEWLPYYTQVAVVDGRVVSAAQICKRTVACGEFRLTMGGIANVATLPEYRGHGYNTECLKRAVAVMEADAMDFSLLFTGINAYYARLGYSDLKRPFWRGTLREGFAPRPSRYTVRPACADDLPDIRAIYDAYNRLRPIAVQRYEAYWRDWVGIHADSIPDDLRVATDTAGQVCGYLRYGGFRSAAPYTDEAAHVSIIEFGVAPEEPEAEVGAALFESVAAQFTAQGAKELRLGFDPEPALKSALAEILTETRPHFSTYDMARLLHRENLLKSFCMEMNDRWIAAGRPGGVLTFATPYGPVSLDASGPFLRVYPVDANVATLSQSTLFELLFGCQEPERVTENTALHPLLAALFPRRGMVYWGADGF